MILLDAVHISRCDALLRTVLQACAAANAGIGYSVAFGGRGCSIERVHRTLDGVGSEVEVIDCDVAHLEDDADIVRIAWIYVGEVGLFGKNYVNPLFLLILGRGFGWCRGCPAVSFGYTGDMYDADPQCWKDLG